MTMSELNADSGGKFDVFLVGVSKISSDFKAKLDKIPYDDASDYSDSDEVLIAEAVNYTQVRHIKKIFEKNSVSFSVKIHEKDYNNCDDKSNFVPRNIALLESLYSAEDYKPSATDGFYFVVIFFAFLLLCINVIYTGHRSDTELHRAVKRQDVAKVEHILAGYPYKSSFKDSFGRTALYYVNGDYSYRIAEILLDSGAEVNIRDENGKTPLEYLSAPEQKTDIKTVYLLSTYKK